MPEEKTNRNHPTLEQLLRVKRAESPDDDFWKRFDRDLEKKIVRSVVARQPWPFAALRWCRGHAVAIGFAAGACMLLLSLVPGLEPPAETVRPEKPAAGQPAAAAAPRSAVRIPELQASRQDFVIEVLSSGSGAASGANLTWVGGGPDGSEGSYYVADQLSSSDLGWSGERLPF